MPLDFTKKAQAAPPSGNGAGPPKNNTAPAVSGPSATPKNTQPPNLAAILNAAGQAARARSGSKGNTPPANKSPTNALNAMLPNTPASCASPTNNPAQSPPGASPMQSAPRQQPLSPQDRLSKILSVAGQLASGAKPIKKPNISAYCYILVDGNSDEYITITEQGYFDTYGGLDDGSGPDFNKIASAMAKAGSYMVEPSIFRPNAGKTADDIIRAMRSAGYSMIENDYDFDEMSEESFDI